MPSTKRSIKHRHGNIASMAVSISYPSGTNYSTETLRQTNRANKILQRKEVFVRRLADLDIGFINIAQALSDDEQKKVFTGQSSLPIALYALTSDDLSSLEERSKQLDRIKEGILGLHNYEFLRDEFLMDIWRHTTPALLRPNTLLYPPTKEALTGFFSAFADNFESLRSEVYDSKRAGIFVLEDWKGIRTRLRRVRELFEINNHGVINLREDYLGLLQTRLPSVLARIDKVIYAYPNKKSYNPPTAVSSQKSVDPHIHARVVFWVAMCAVVATIFFLYRTFQTLPNAPGNTGDCDFWQLLQSSAMQSVSFAATLCAAGGNGNQSKFERCWIWAMATVGFVCPIGGIAVYTLLPLGYSVCLTSTGSAIQTFLIVYMLLAS